MTTKVIHVRSTKAKVKEKIRQLIKTSLGRQFRSQLVFEYLTLVQEAYDIKSDGGTDQFGDKWEPLKPATIAARPISPTDRKRYKLGTVKRTRGLLTPGQDKRWRGIYYSKFKKLVETLPIDEAKTKAAEYAWAVLKGQGAITRIGTLADRDVPIMKDTLQLYDACCPGRMNGEEYQPPKNQLVEITQRTIRIYIDVPYAADAMLVRPVFLPEKGIGIAIEKALESFTENFSL